MQKLIKKIKDKLIAIFDFSQEVSNPQDSGMTLGKLLAETTDVPDLNTPVEICAFWAQGSFRANGVYFDGNKLTIYVEERRKPRDNS